MVASYLISFKYSDMKPIRQAASNNQYNYSDNKRLPWNYKNRQAPV